MSRQSEWLATMHAWESARPPLMPLYISRAMYQACRRARPNVPWGEYEQRLDIQVGITHVAIHMDTAAYPAICEAMTDTYQPIGPEGPQDF